MLSTCKTTLVTLSSFTTLAQMNQSIEYFGIFFFLSFSFQMKSSVAFLVLYPRFFLEDVLS